MKQSRAQLGFDFDVQGGEQRECEGLSSACAVGLGLFGAAAGGPQPSLALFLVWGEQTPPAVTTWLPLHLGTVLSTWGVPLHTEGLRFFGSQGFLALLARNLRA